MNSSASCSAAACTSTFPKCASAAYVNATLQSFAILAQPPTLVSSGAGSICYISARPPHPPTPTLRQGRRATRRRRVPLPRAGPYTCTSGVISYGLFSTCPVGSVGASVVDMGVLTTGPGSGSASLQCANNVADVAWDGVFSVCNSNGCNRPPAGTLVASPAARPALAALGALAAAAAAALL